MQQLTEHEILPEEWGGDTIFVPISAKHRTNIDTLLEMVLLVADMKELKANYMILHLVQEVMMKHTMLRR